MNSDKTIIDFLPELERALEYAGGTHDMVDVARAVVNGDAQLWVEGDAMIVTQIDEKPKAKHLVLWLACGKLRDVQDLSEKVLAWGCQMGCDKAVSVCRKGWKRAMSLYGWYEPPDLVILERDL